MIEREMVTEPAAGPLTLRHASKRSSGTWGPDDYDVFSGERDIGPDLQAARRRPAGLSLDVDNHRGSVAPRLPSHGFSASLDEAKSKFAETWRAWLALTR